MASRGAASPKLALPTALEAETSVLGAVMFGNEAMAHLPEALEPRHFSEPLHQRMFARMRLMYQAGQLIEPVALGAAFASDPAYGDVGGMRYLADILERAPPWQDAPQYARVVIEVGIRRALMAMGQEIMERAADAGEDPTILLGDISREAGHMHTAAHGVSLVGADDAVDGVLDYVDNPGKHAAGIYTGLEPLDTRLGPWLPGDLISLAGRPGSGKSAEAAIIGMNVATGGVGVVEIHAEMTVHQAWRRRLTATAYSLFGDEAPAYSAIRKRTITYDQRQMLEKAREQLRGIPLMAVKRTGMTLAQLWALVARQKAAWARLGIPLGLLTIDHAGLITSGADYRTRVDEQTAVSNGLKVGADQHQVATLALLQLSRAVEGRDDKRPQLHDLRDSGSWEQDCDVVIGTYREAYYAAREKEPSSTGTKGGIAWAEWKARSASPWIENILLKVREGDVSTAKLWGHMASNTILGEAPADNFFRGL